ncbi:MAG: hypothetical protein ACKOBZ_05170 [Nitrospira sp.]|nr:hypothetical protein [Nitrospira sp.]
MSASPYALLMILTGTLLGSCSATPAQPSASTADVILEAPASAVRHALVEVLTQGGYEVERDANSDSEIRTGYRKEISNYNWLYTSRFGIMRSKVTVTLAAEDETSTRITVQVWYEGKSGDWMPLTSSWVPYDAAVPQSAANTIQLVKNELGLL